MRRPAYILPLLIALSMSCGDITSPDDDDDDDEVAFDAAAGAGDAGDPDGAAAPDAHPAPDAPPLRTPCGMMSCDRATQICVRRFGLGPIGPPTCERVPEGCEGDRSCDCVGEALCTDISNVCIDVDADNTVHCECPICA